jgi:hypothetical protein
MNHVVLTLKEAAAVANGDTAVFERPMEITEQPRLAEAGFPVSVNIGLGPVGFGARISYQTGWKWSEQGVHWVRSVFGAPGQRLWVAEPWVLENLPGDGLRVVWLADMAAAWAAAGEVFYLESTYEPAPRAMRAAESMEQWASRFTLAILDVQVFRKDGSPWWRAEWRRVATNPNLSGGLWS